MTALNRLVMALRLVVLPLFVLSIGRDESFYGLLVAGAGYAEGLFLPLTGMFSDVKGRGRSIMVGGLITGSAFFILPFVGDPILLLAVYSVTGVGDGFIVSSVEAMIADHSRDQDERTKTYGFTISIATLAATVGPFVGGYLLDEMASPWIEPEVLRYMIVFFMMGSARVVAGVLGFSTERWLVRIEAREGKTQSGDHTSEVVHTSREDFRTALLFGLSQAIMGMASGMVVPYLIPWMYARFTPDKLVLGSVAAMANISLASGTLAVGMFSERIGKLKTVLLLYMVTPLLAVGLVMSPVFSVMVVFYVVREATANMVRPATNSLFMGEITPNRRGRLWALTRVMWTFPRQTGTLITSLLLAMGIFSNIVDFGILYFPLATTLYPVSVIPMYLAIRREKTKVPKENP